ncbi:hypothetical protein [Bradyrhizobium sp. BWC-3-1]|uniref:hypothetical protein n=1 Tax=Bradyrhizobium sp. BWC-3-1 TaxID=3080012 RepID=UPI00293F3CDA|nr:hypothetical protein [Bradyrhizobium sp. BWC-3-1]WOH58175.1 hypothetical protein RX329_39755 [Bradyrhizobium sp. BWC-3-1]
MRAANSSTASWLVAAAFAAVLTISGGCLAAQSAPDSENGRYSMTPIPEGVLRLDSRTGTVSTCTRSGAGWACYAVPDERTALDAEIGRLQAEVETLKGRLAQAPKAAEGERRIEIPLPSDQDVDRVMSFLERAWRRLIDMANRVQKDVSGKI